MSDIQQQFEAIEHTPFRQVREDAFRAFEKLGIPSSRHEEWKYTNIKAKLSKEFTFTPQESEVNKSVKAYISSLPAYAFRMVFLNGVFQSSMSIIPDLKGLTISSLREAFAAHPELIEKHYGKLIDNNEEHFAALNTAFVNDGAFIHVSRNVNIEEPIFLHYFFTAGEAEAFTQTRNLVIAEEGASIQLAEDFRNASNIGVQYNHVSEVYVGKNAQVNVAKLQTETKNVIGIHTMEAQVDTDARFYSTTITFEANVIRNNATARLVGRNAHADLSGLYFAKDTAHIDTHILIDHVAPDCTSHQLYKGVLNDQATGIFNGKIFVKPDAQKTNAFQSSKALLLSPEASVNSKPQLEIFADDVKCSHGAAIGQLSAVDMFYMLSRGIPEEQAKQLLTYAFAHEVVEKIQSKPLRQHLCDKLKEALNLQL
jgi:Fe-S cluster assembly protein SufD